MKRRIAVRGIVFKNGELLCVRHTGYRTGKQADYWCPPGGGIDEGEGLHAAIEREMLEETGIKPSVGALLYIQQYADDVQEELEFFFHITNPEDYETIDLTNTSHGETEIAELGFVNPISVKLLPNFLAEVDIAKDINSNSPTQIFSYP